MHLSNPATLTLLALTARLGSALPQPSNSEIKTLATRDVEGDFTVFYPLGGVGACGQPIQDSDFVAALNANHFGEDVFDPVTGENKNPNCGRHLVATYRGVSVTVTILDRCSSCASGDVEFTRAAWTALTGSDVGIRVRGSWRFF